MVNAVVLAGGKSKVTLEDLLGRIIELPFYREVYLFGTYKPLIKVGGEIEGIRKMRPVIEYPLHALAASKNIEGIKVVGEKEKLEKGLDINLKIYSERCDIIQQVGSLSENVLHGYKSFGKKEHTLFLTADAPLSTSEGIDNFISICSKDFAKYDVFYPVVSRKHLYKYEDSFKNRRYFWIRDDVTNEQDEFMIKGMRGFRIANMVIANIDAIKNLDFVDFAYSARKLRNPINAIKLLATFWEEEVKYFKGTLKLSEVQDKISDVLGTRFKLVEIADAGSSLDLDAYCDKEGIEKINGYHEHVKHNS